MLALLCEFTENVVLVSRTIALALALVLASYTKNAWAERSVAEYLKDGWDIKAITQISPIGYTQVVMQKGLMGVICTIYYSVKDNGWTAVGGCTPVP
jgi:hypothetical protein